MLTVIFDIDGTLSSADHRAHYVECDNPDWESFLKPELVALDTVIEGSQRGFKHLAEIADEIIFLTGRNEGLREVTTMWLFNNFADLLPNGNHHLNIVMRPIGDNRIPSEYKTDALRGIENRLAAQGLGASTILAVDDDKWMMGVYRKLGYITLHAPDCWLTLFPDFDHLTNETTWRR